MKSRKIILTMTSIFVGFTAGAACVCRVYWKYRKSADEKLNRLRGYYSLLNQWLQLKQSGISLEQYFIGHSYKTIAIYGLGELGMRLQEEIKGSAVNMHCAIDKKAEEVYSDIKVYYPEDCPKDIDVIVVTPTFAFEKIREELSRYTDCPIISLEEILFSL